MQSNKDNLRETITIELGALVFLLGIVYILVKTVF